MSQMPIVGMLSPFLGKVRTGAGGAQLVRAVLNVVSGLGHALRPQAPIDGPNILTVAVGAPVLDKYFSPLFLKRAAVPKNVGRPFALGDPGKKYDYKENGRKNDQTAAD
jgi:hypothetical protein